MLVLKLIYNVLKNHFSMAGNDPRTKHLPLVNSYAQILVILVAYVLITTRIGPALMANRRPYNVNHVIKMYNIAQILFNAYIFLGLVRTYTTHPKYNWLCMPIDRTDFSPATMRLLQVTYLCYMSKLIDLLDTVFFVLRKKFNQISFLHVYHHCSMVWAGFLYHNEFLGSTFTTVGYVNSFVHVLMYTYYLVSASDMKINLDKWKPRMTQIQIVQFLYFSIKIGCAVFNNTCGLPSFWLGVLFIQNMFVTVMFSNFYYKTYILKQTKIKSTK